ncbi:hypothetical protein H9635_08040 [Solibacillus sp. A46]|uniref:Uncharacterized protein n=1 Tax=Solibacillus faecavium TaxID=2762221 RepID=A0ABR8XXM6_9BACL|nr:hypothetical protein [Solibacillus faecavium]MBD8036689.1 hypothetical protein [Solibacillus faecavium]
MRFLALVDHKKILGNSGNREERIAAHNYYGNLVYLGKSTSFSERLKLLKKGSNSLKIERVSNLKFNYNITGVGWAICEIQTANGTFTFRASYISDALGDLLNALLSLNSDMNTESYADETKFSWYQEPGLTEWHIKAFDIKSNGENLHFKINQYIDDTEKGAPETTSAFACNYDEFVYSVVESLDRLMQKFGLVGYQAIWVDADFPVVAYLKLKHYTIHKTAFPFVDGQNGTLKTMTSRDYEMKLLTTDLKDC